VLLRVTDPDGAFDQKSFVVMVDNSPPEVFISSPSPDLTWSVGQEILFEGYAVDAQDGILPPENLSWNLTIMHCPDACHAHPYSDFADVDSGSFSAPDHEYPSHLILSLSATDSDGVKAAASIELHPLTVILDFLSEPPGMVLTVGEREEATAFSVEVIAHSLNTVIAPLTQHYQDVPYKFVAWSDGAPALHEVVAPPGGAVYEAVFIPACGDGLLDPEETCDHAENNGVGCCSYDCQWREAGSTCLDDGVACTSQACDGAGTCVYSADDSACDDGDACTADSCNSATGCQNVDFTASCDDGNACTADSCDPDAGCHNADITASCDDGNACTADSCDPDAGCQHADITASCDDANACTADSCNPDAGCQNLALPLCGQPPADGDEGEEVEVIEQGDHEIEPFEPNPEAILDVLEQSDAVDYGWELPRVEDAPEHGVDNAAHDSSGPEADSHEAGPQPSPETAPGDVGAQPDLVSGQEDAGALPVLGKRSGGCSTTPAAAPVPWNVLAILLLGICFRLSVCFRERAWKQTVHSSTGSHRGCSNERWTSPDVTVFPSANSIGAEMPGTI